MASLAMKRIFICGLKSDRKKILEELQRQGSIEVQDFVEEDDVFRKSKMPISAAEFERHIHDAETALEILREVNGEKPPGMFSSLNGRKPASAENYDNFKDECTQTLAVVTNILALNKELTEKKAEVIRCGQQIEMLEPWKSLDIRLDFSGTEATCAFIGAIPKSWEPAEIYAAIEEKTDALIDLDVISRTKEQTCIMVLGCKEDEDSIETALRGIGFVYPSVSCSSIPVNEKARLTNRIEDLNLQIAAGEEKIRSYNDKTESIKFMRDYMSIREEKYSVTNNLPQSEHTFLLSGYTPAIYVPEIEKSLSQYDVVIETEDPAEDEEVPVLLKNNAFSTSVQGVVEAYALPKKGEIDPTFLISLFYFVFFGFMLSDAGIGLLLFLGAGFLLLKYKNMESSLRRQVRLFMYGGISAMFWGVMFGSYFGDMIPVVSSTFFGNKVLVKPVWMDMQANPMMILAVSLGLGLIHIFTGMGVAAYQQIKQKDWVALIFDTFAWVVILVGLLIKLLAMDMIMNMLFSGREPFFSAQTGNGGMIAAGVAAIAVLIMGGRESRNPIKRLLKGAYAIYGITSYLSDVLSYSRLLALGLATGVISQVANMIGTMFGSGFVKVLVYIVVFIILNAINAGVNIMGAYVHTNRLQYVEFYSRFFEGGGRAFQPYSIKTKYYKIKEN